MIAPLTIFDLASGSLDARVTFARTTGASNPATYVNSSGYIASATNNEPRFNYDPVTLACKGLLIEESRANLAEASETLGNTTYWAQVGATVSSDAATSPSNTTTGDKVVEDIATSEHMIRNSFSATGITYVFSCYLKAAERTWAVLQFFDGFSAISRGYSFDIANGQIGTMIGASGVSATIENAGNGWWRCSITRTMAGTSAASRVQIQTAINTSTRSYTGDGVSGIYAWGAQLEVGANATSYIPTITAALTRNADVATVTGSNFSDFWQAGKGGAQVVAIPSTTSGTRPLVQFDDGTANEIIALQGNAANPELYIVDGGTPQVQLDAGTITANASHTLTGWWDTNDCRARYDSGTTVTDQTATIPTVTQMRIGSDGTNYLNGHIATIGYYDRFSGQVYSRRKNKAVFQLL